MEYALGTRRRKMMTVKEMSRLTGVSIRTLHYYDQIGLLHPSEVTEAGYRKYGESELARLQQILLFRELEFPLKDIRAILDSPDFDQKKAIEQQIRLLYLKKEHLDALILLAREIKSTGGKKMDFKAFDTAKIDEYTKKAKEEWGKTDAYREYEQKSKGRSVKESMEINEGLMNIFKEFGQMKDREPESAEVQELVKKLQDYITDHFYRCTDEILSGLGKMYAGDAEFSGNIDRAGGKGCAAFASAAIDSCMRLKK
jgi:DNA-binding transcriptional MerR regulator